MRVSKINYYLDIAQTVSERCTCLRRRYGAIIVKKDSIVSTGYNGAPRGRENCCDINFCIREKMNIPHGERYELCRSIHAESNAIISASREEMDGAVLYMACTDPESGEIVSGTNNCMMCRRRPGTGKRTPCVLPQRARRRCFWCAHCRREWPRPYRR